MRDKRILHVTECYAGGVSRAIDTLVGLAPEAEHHLVWSGDETPSDDAGYRSIQTMPRLPWAAAMSIRRAVDRVQPDVVHAHSSWAGVFTRIAGLRVPIVYEPHCYKFDDLEQPGALRAAYRVAEKVLAPGAHTTVVLSPHEEQLARAIAPKGRTHFLPNTASLRPSDAHPATGFDTARTVFMIGRLSPQKDPSYFADVARAVRGEDESVRFRWIGDGDAAMRADLQSAGVEVTGWLSGDEMAAALAEPGLYLHVARYEGFPLSILDAAAFEHPVAVREIPAFDELGIPSARTPVEAAALVRQILDDADVRDAAIRAARDLDATMNTEAQRRALDDLYSSI